MACTQAEEFKENEFVTEERRQWIEGYCEGAIDALIDTVDDWCVPHEVSWGEVNRTVRKAVMDVDLSYERVAAGRVPSSAKFVSDALQLRWPCR
jgi:hypothetical protein